jgi:hypothetical protein
MIYNFDPHQQFSNIDKLPDHRSDSEQLNSLLSLFNHDNPDIAYAERTAYELINVSGAWITVYKRARDVGNKDEVFEEDANPKYVNGVRLKGFFVPEPAKTVLLKFGADVENETIVEFSRANVLKLFGRKMISEGDILIVPHNTLAVVQSTDSRDGPLNRIDTYRVLGAYDTGDFKYRWLYWSVKVQNITGDPSIQVDFRSEAS